MGAAHLLMEMVIVRFDGGAHQPQNEDNGHMRDRGPLSLLFT